MTNQTKEQTTKRLSGGPLTIDEVCRIANSDQEMRFRIDSQCVSKMEKATALVDQAVEDNATIYGVTTGFGGMAGEPVRREQAIASQHNLLSFLATGAGEPIDKRHTRAAMLLRANMLLKGRSGVRLDIVRRMLEMLEHDVTPVVRELGSIGASGDLVPLSVIARAITGAAHVRVDHHGEIVDGGALFQTLGWQPIDLLPKEGLAIVNGTSFSAAIAAHAVCETRRLLGVSMAAHAMMLQALNVQEEPFESFVHEQKPHPGQVATAAVFRRLLREGREYSNGKPSHVQDRYSLRCLPQYLGPIVECVSRSASVVEIEMNAVSDNPLIDTETGRFYQSGNFLGQYVGMAMDDLRRSIGLLAKHIDVQIASLVTPEFSNGLPASLRGNDQRSYNMGLKGLQITGNSIMPLLTYYGNPHVDHFPTHAEQFNQNINGLSWGAAHLAWRSVELLQHYLSVALIFSVQAVDLRAKSSLGHFDGRAILGSWVAPVYEAVCQVAGAKPGQKRPLLFNDGDQWIEEMLDSLAVDLKSNGTVIERSLPITEAIDTELSGS